MDKKVHFITGLPRAGSTLLCNILMQNPRFHATATSPLFNLLSAHREFYWAQTEVQAQMSEAEGKRSVENFMKGGFEGYFKHVEKPVIFDKSRGWLKSPEIAEMVLGTKPKFIVCVRDVLAVLASFEKLWRKCKTYKVITQERAQPVDFHTIDLRCAHFMLPGQILGAPIAWIEDAKERGFGSCMHFVEYELLCDYPEDTLKQIYAFLEEEPFAHDLENIKQVIHENDIAYGWPELHSIQEGKIVKSKSNPNTLLTKDVKTRYGPKRIFWKEGV